MRERGSQHSYKETYAACQSSKVWILVVSKTDDCESASSENSEGGELNHV